MFQLIFIYVVIAFFVDWWPFNDTASAISGSDYNVYFYYPGGGKEEYLGRVTGLPACNSSARSFAYNKNISHSDWSYICCRIAHGSACYSKHR